MTRRREASRILDQLEFVDGDNPVGETHVRVHAPERLTRHPKILGRESKPDGGIVEGPAELCVDLCGTLGPPLDRQRQRERRQLRQRGRDRAAQRVGIKSEHDAAAHGVGTDVEPRGIKRRRAIRGVKAGVQRARPGVVQPQIGRIE